MHKTNIGVDIFNNFENRRFKAGQIYSPRKNNPYFLTIEFIYKLTRVEIKVFWTGLVLYNYVFQFKGINHEDNTTRLTQL